MGVVKERVLLSVELLNVSEKTLFKLRSHKHNPEHAFDILPEYTLGNNKNLIEARYYHQFTGLHEEDCNDKEYLFMRFTTLDSSLSREIIDSGIEEVLSGFDLEKYLSVFTPEKANKSLLFDQLKSNYLVLELIHTTSYDNYSGGYEYELDIDIVGYLNKNLEFVAYSENNV